MYKEKNISTNRTAFISPTLLSIILGFDFLTNNILNDIIKYNIKDKHEELKKIIRSIETMKNFRIYETDEFMKRFNLT